MLSFLFGFIACYLAVGAFIFGTGVVSDIKAGHSLTWADVGVVLLLLVIWPWPLKTMIEEF